MTERIQLEIQFPEAVSEPDPRLSTDAWAIYYWVDQMAAQVTARADAAAAKNRTVQAADDFTDGSAWLYAKSVALREVCIGILNKDFVQ